MTRAAALLALILLLPGRLLAQVPAKLGQQLAWDDEPGTSPRVELRQPAIVRQVLALPDGSRVLVGNFEWVNGRPQPGCARFGPDGQPDSAFNRRVAPFGRHVAAVAAAPGNKLLMALLGADNAWNSDHRQVYKQLLRLNADGSADASFAWPGAVPATVESYEQAGALAVQADGRILLAGNLAVAAQGPVPKPMTLARLLAGGQLDTAFQRQLGQAISSLTWTTAVETSAAQNIQLQPDGRLLLSGRFFSPSGQPRPSLIRLLGSGALDASFQPPLGPGQPVQALAVLPDGKVLAVVEHCAQLARSLPYGRAREKKDDSYCQQQSRLLRLLPSGQPDPAFFIPFWRSWSNYQTHESVLLVQADGRILVAAKEVNQRRESTAPDACPVARLRPNGRPDRRWRAAEIHAAQGEQLLQALPAGRVLVAGAPAVYGPVVSAPPIPVGVLDEHGRYQPDFAPKLQAAGGTTKSLTQTDGSTILAGYFSEVNGLPARNMARVLATGEVDTAFNHNARTWGAGESVNLLRRQADGCLLIAGGFSRVGEAARAGLARLLPDGRPDPSYPPLKPALAKKLFLPEWITPWNAPWDTLTLYRHCGQRLTVPASLPPGRPRLRLVVRGAAMELDHWQRNATQSMTIEAYAPQAALTVYRRRRLVLDYPFKVREIPAPEIRCVLSDGEKPLATQPLSARSLQLLVIPDAAFASYLPEDARYRVSRAVITLMRRQQVIGLPLVFDQRKSESVTRQVGLAALPAQAEPGDELRVEVQQVQRKNYCEEIEEIALTKQFVFRLQ